MAPWGGPTVDTEWKFFSKFRSADGCKMHFSWILLGILGFYWEFLCLFVSIKTKEQEKQVNGMENLSRVLQKQKREKNT